MPPRLNVVLTAKTNAASVDPSFVFNYAGADHNGIIRGAYHVARPDESRGEVQAEFFLANGGIWRGDGITLPGAVNLEGTLSTRVREVPYPHIL